MLLTLSVWWLCHPNERWLPSPVTVPSFTKSRAHSRVWLPEPNGCFKSQGVRRIKSLLQAQHPRCVRGWKRVLPLSRLTPGSGTGLGTQIQWEKSRVLGGRTVKWEAGHWPEAELMPAKVLLPLGGPAPGSRDKDLLIYPVPYREQNST